MTVRVRFAPSPTGMFHVGGARSALQNWIFAKQHGGVFILRIEDTDTARNRPEWTEGILTAMEWIGIERGSYEGPLFQSSYLAEQQKAIQQLIDGGKAYYCTCTRDEINERTDNKYGGYDGFCRDRGLTSGAIRFRTPDEGVTVVKDLIRGEPSFENKNLDDFVIARGDGSPVFMLANVADDITQGITHVIRAEEHLPNTPKQQLLWEALGKTPPIWAHVPVVVNEKRQKLSKRRDKVALEMYRDEGYLADAMRNYLMLLGWAPSGDREIVPWSVIEAEFRLEDVNPSPAFFDEKKLRAFNGEYIRALTVPQFIDACQPWLTGPFKEEGAEYGIAAPPWAPHAYDPALFEQVAELAQTRIAVLSEIVPNVDFLFLDRPRLDDAAWAKAGKDAHILPSVIEAFSKLESWDAQSLKDTLIAVGEAHELKLGKAQAPVRVAVTGKAVGLPLFESLEVLGREKTLQRLNALASVS
ncbi:glutamate--tRNA ligase [Catelliglobosispora koreensis]|uniref:glutamate--tRNA ligase n=1 Tax=Catelliglobosispora koreensis TaxID=129052 RepID=UPI000A0415F6|nr:glutamate--tRNA ligase [Catelliglobosispora koreensis]